MDNRELLTKAEYLDYLNRSVILIPYRFALLFTPLIFILSFSDFLEFNLVSSLTKIFTSLTAMVILFIWITLNQKNNIHRNQNSTIRDKNRGVNNFNDSYSFSIPVTLRFISDELPGVLYFSADKITFLANRIIGLKLVWFNLDKLDKGYYDLNFLPNSFESTYKIVEQPLILRFILKHPTKLLIIKEKRLNTKKRYIYKIPTTHKVENAFEKLEFLSN